MPLLLIREDITKMKTDAIVNAANESLLGGGGVDGAIHRAAGPGLLEECRTLGGCRPGEAKLSGGYRLPAHHVIHTVGPRWQGGRHGEEATLRACYRHSLELAQAHGFETVAFPLISGGIFGYPKADAIRIAQEEIRRFLDGADMTVYLILRDRGALPGSEAEREAVAAYLESRLGGDDANMLCERDALPEPSAAGAVGRADAPVFSRMTRPQASKTPRIALRRKESAPASEPDEESFIDDLNTRLAELDESFSQMLLRKISEKGMTDAACYKKANIDRKLFSKIRSDALYRPSKPTALAFAVALELPPAETAELLRKAGYALSPASKFDVIVEYFISRGEYDIFRINEALFAFDQNLLGA